MTTNLPQDSEPVKDSTEPINFLPTPEDRDARAAEIVEWVRRFVRFSNPLPTKQELSSAALAVESVAVYVHKNWCCCQACLQRAAEGDSFLYYCLRAEVFRRIGRPASNIAHRPDTRK